MQASVALSRLSGIHLRLGESGKALQEAEDGLRIRRALFGDRHAHTVNAWQDVAQAALADNQLGRAEVAAGEALRHCRGVQGDTAPACALHQLTQGSALLALGQYQERAGRGAGGGAAGHVRQPGAARRRGRGAAAGGAGADRAGPASRSRRHPGRARSAPGANAARVE